MRMYENDLELEVRPGEEINPFMFSKLPWNCIDAKYVTNYPLLKNLKFEPLKEDTKTFFILRGKMMTSNIQYENVTIGILCSDLVKLKYGTIHFKQCDKYDSSSQCVSNGCCWSSSKKICVFCEKTQYHY